MSNHGPTRRRGTDFVELARSCFEGSRFKLVAVLLLDALLTSITGVGLLLILPLLGLLGLAPGVADNPIWQRLNAALERMGLTLTLETGLVLFTTVICARVLLNWRRETWQVEVEQTFQTSLRHRLYETLSRTELYWLQRLRTSEFVQATQGEIRRVQDAVDVLFQLVSTVLRLGVYFVVALVLSREMTLFAFVCGLGGPGHAATDPAHAPPEPAANAHSLEHDQQPDRAHTGPAHRAIAGPDGAVRRGLSGAVQPGGRGRRAADPPVRALVARVRNRRGACCWRRWSTSGSRDSTSIRPGSSCCCWCSYGCSRRSASSRTRCSDSSASCRAFVTTSTCSTT